MIALRSGKDLPPLDGIGFKAGIHLDVVHLSKLRRVAESSDAEAVFPNELLHFFVTFVFNGASKFIYRRIEYIRVKSYSRTVFDIEGKVESPFGAAFQVLFVFRTFGSYPGRFVKDYLGGGFEFFDLLWGKDLMDKVLFRHQFL